jgi:hypothetical protein
MREQGLRKEGSACWLGQGRLSSDEGGEEIPSTCSIPVQLNTFIGCSTLCIPPAMVHALIGCKVCVLAR